MDEYILYKKIHQVEYIYYIYFFLDYFWADTESCKLTQQHIKHGLVMQT